jgi:hypothetical protein
MAKSKNEMIVEEKYAPPYPQGFHAFYPKHAIKAGFTVAVTLALIVVLAIYYQVPTNHDMPPLPDHGVNVPAPEWYLMFLFEPFWYLTGENAIWRQIGTFWIPLGFLGAAFVFPLFFGRKKADPSKPFKGFGRAIWVIFAVGFWVVITAGVVGSGYSSKTTSCISCHTPMEDHTLALPPIDMAAHYRNVRQMEIYLNRYRDPDMGGTPERYKDATWNLRHVYAPTENW